MSARLTAGQANARRALWALAATALDVIDMRAAGGIDEDDDRPRLWLLTVQRWTRGEATGAELAAATKAMDAWRTEATDYWWPMATWTIRDAREDLARHPSHATMHAAGSIYALASALPADAPGANAERVERIYAAHLRTAERDAVEALVGARLRRAREDKGEAERVLGTREEP